MRSCAHVLIPLLLGTAALAQSVQPFRTGTELVAIDITVVDSSGNPVPDLEAHDFAVTVAGQPRTIQSVQFIRSEPTATPAGSGDADVASNQRSPSGRALLIVVDESNLRPGSGVALVRNARALLTRISPGDVVGLARIPEGGGVEFTSNHAHIVDALNRVTGRPPRARGSSVTVFLSEAVDSERSGAAQWAAALRRECPPPTQRGYALCVAAMQAEATALLRDEEWKRRAVAESLRNLIRTAAASSGPVTMVLISQSLFLGDDVGLVASLADAAASARVTLHVVRPAGGSFDISNAGFSSDPSTDEALRRHGLEQLAAALNGGYFEPSSASAEVFERIGRELTGYYLLGIEPTDEDRRSRRRPLDVIVTRPGLTWRARSTFTARSADETTELATADSLRLMLRSPINTPGLPMTLTTRVVDAGDDTHVRLLLSAEIGDPITTPTTYHVGLAIIGAKGEVVTSNAATMPLPPLRSAAPAPARFTTSVVVTRGDYSIRLAAISRDGRLGSVHHQASASLRQSPGGFSSSDLIVAPEPARGGFPVFNASGIIDGPQVAVLLELTHKDATALDAASVRFHVDRFRADAVPTRAERKSGSKNGRRFAAILPVDLAPGDYELQAIVTPRAGAPFRLSRTFKYVPSTTLLSASLGVEAVRRQIEALEQLVKVSAALSEFVERAKAGDFIAAPEADSRPQGDLAMVTFVGGVVAIRDNKPALARVLLLQTVKAAPSFEGATSYLSLLK